MNIFEINAEIEQLLERATDPETGEIDVTSLQRLYELTDARHEKVEDIALAYKNAKAEAEAIKGEADKLTRRARAAANNADRIKDLLSYALDGQKLKTPRVNVYYTRTKSVEVEDASLLTDEYLRYSDPTPNKTAIKAAIDAGIDVPGAGIVERVNVQVR